MNTPHQDRIARFLQREESNLPRTLERIYFRRNSSNLNALLLGVEAHALAKGMYGFYVEGDAAKLKQWFHVAARVRLADPPRDLGPGSWLLDALLSDNEATIQLAAKASSAELRKSGANPLYPDFHIRMIQQAILGEDEALRQSIAKLAKNGEKRYRKTAAAGTDFYSLLLARDHDGLTRLIHESAKINSADPLFEDVMSHLAALQTKLCWRRGIEVQIDSPMVPMELMPVRPLSHYDDVYEFIRPGWVPPRQGLLGRIERLFCKTTIPR
ncbi:immunity 49 family protein [Herbaspirillum seropedicae]|uniref:immunity 49 family protein n=1 Tax=Herbaspirillum seropedicae TaxID=964 RepID=UPI003D967A6C